MKNCPNCQSGTLTDEAVICTECGYNFQTGGVIGATSASDIPTEYDEHIQRLKGSWVKVGSFLVTTVGIIFGAGLLYLRASYVEANGGVLILPKPLMILYHIGGKNLACGFLLLSAFMSLMSAIAFLPWNFIEAEWFLSLVYKIAHNFRFAVYSIVAITLLSFIYSANEYYSASKAINLRTQKLHLVLEDGSDNFHPSGLEKKKFVENLVNHERWPELESVLGENKITLWVSYFDSNKPGFILSLTYKSKRLPKIEGAIGDPANYIKMNRSQIKSFVTLNKLKLSKEYCDNLIDYFVKTYKE